MPLRDDAIAIWKAGVAAVDSERLCRDQIQLTGDVLTIAGQSFDVRSIRRIEVVGAGKAGAGMAAGVEQALEGLPDSVQASGWINVPADCVQPRRWIHPHAARPAGLNEPTPEAVAGTAEILSRVSGLSDADVCIVLLSGGGSALLCAPVPKITLEDKVAVTRRLAASGAPIEELNAVRTRLSMVKGGGLAKASRAGATIALIVSDVVGDPLSTIASGPTTPPEASERSPLQIMADRGIPADELPPRVVAALTDQNAEKSGTETDSVRCSNHVIGSNRVAVQAAAAEATRRGYLVETLGSDNVGEASEEGLSLYRRLHSLRPDADGPVCVLSGGEPTVRLAQVDVPRSGGRNQELVLAAVTQHPASADWDRIVLLSGGTDGEDGPTDAAGAVADAALVERMLTVGLNPADYLRINNSYPFFQQLDGLLKTGPTHTNVMDLRVGLVSDRPDDT